MVRTFLDNRGRSRTSKAIKLPLLLAVGLLGLIIATNSQSAAAADSWWNNNWHYRHLITVNADGHARSDKPVEVKLNFTPLLADQGGSGALDPDSIRVIEIDGDDNVIDDSVPFQFDRAGDYHATSQARGTLTFLLAGSTAATETRRYHVYFDVTGGGFNLPEFTDRVMLTDGVGYKGYQSVRVVTADAEYFYHKPGGGFATLFDADNNDWIGWNSATAGAGDFRGIPNMVHPNNGGYFHPGRNNTNTTVLADGPLKATFRSVSNGGAWEVVWDIFPDYARMKLVRKGDSNFWWLYEGTPGGELNLSADRLTRSNGDSIPASGSWGSDIPGDEWVFVTDPAVERSLYLIHHQEDSKVDGYAADGTGQMTIFGFGRSGNQRLLNSLPQQFTFGFVDETALNGVRPVVNAAYKPLAITGENDAGDDVDPGPVCVQLPYSVYLSPKKAGAVEGLIFADEDVIKYDGTTCEWSLIFDGTAAGLPASANVDALAVVENDIYLSFLAPVKNVPGIPGVADDSDVVRFTGGIFSLFLDGSVYGLTTDAEDIDAIAFDNSGNLLISTLGAYLVPGLPKGSDDDLIKLDGANWQVFFDGSHYAGLGAEDIAGADVAANEYIYLSVLDAFSVPGAKGNATDIFQCVPSSLGFQSTQCTYGLMWRSSSYGLVGFNAFDIE